MLNKDVLRKRTVLCSTVSMSEKLLAAQILAALINQDRFEGKVADSEDTVRLCELLDQITVRMSQYP